MRASSDASPIANIGKLRVFSSERRQKLIRDHFKAQQRPHTGHHVEIINRLGNKIIRAGLQAANAIGCFFKRRDHNDRDMPRFRVAL